MHMFGTETEADQSGRNAAQPGKARQEPQRERRQEGTRLVQHRLDHSGLNEQLHALRHLRGPFTPRLHQTKVLRRQPPLAQRHGQLIRYLIKWNSKGKFKST